MTAFRIDAADGSLHQHGEPAALRASHPSLRLLVIGNRARSVREGATTTEVAANLEVFRIGTDGTLTFVQLRSRGRAQAAVVDGCRRAAVMWTALYNGAVTSPTPGPRMAVLSADTTAEIEQRQIDAWRRLSPAERLRLVSDATRAVMDLSVAGIRRRHPHASERERFLRLAAIVLGVDTARRVYPDAALLTDLRGPW